MYVTRWVERVKIGKAKELVELMKAMPEHGVPWAPHGVRIYWSGDFSEWEWVVFEQEFESLAEYEKVMKEIYAAPGTHEWIVQHRELLDGPGRGELWRMETIK